MSNVPTTYGLTQAHLLASANNVNVYQPKSYLTDDQWWGNKAQAPTQTQWQAPSFQKLDSQASPTYQTYAAQAPTYKGLSGGDYDRYELNLRAPGETAAQRAYQQAKTDLDDAYSARGLYGSSQYTRQMTGDLQSRYMDTLADNAAQAASNRYQMEQKDLQYAQDNEMRAWMARMSENQAANQQAQRAWEVDYGNRLTENNLMNQYAYESSVDQRNWDDQMANRQTSFTNTLAQDRQNWDQNRLNWDANQNDATWNRIMGLWGNYDPEAEAWQRKILKNQADASDQQKSGLGGLVSGAGGLIGKAVSLVPGWGTAAGGLISMGSSLAGSLIK